MLIKSMAFKGSGFLFRYVAGVNRLFWAFFAALVLSAGVVNAEEKPKYNVLAKSVGSWGALSCLDRVNQVTEFVGFNEASGAIAMMPPAQADTRVVPISMEIPTGRGTAYVSANFSPNQSNGCGATYDAVVYWAERCTDVASSQYKAFKNIGPMESQITVLDGGVATKVFLMPAGSGCVSIKKEVVY